MKKLILILFIFCGMTACVVDKEISLLSDKVTKVVKTEKKELVELKKELTLSEIRKIINHVSQNWEIPYIKLQKDFPLYIPLLVEIKSNGEVIKVGAVNKDKYKNNSHYKIIADSAIKAVNISSPLPVPKGKSELMKTFIMDFETALANPKFKKEYEKNIKEIKAYSKTAEKTVKFVKWECYEINYSKKKYSNHLLTVGYFPFFTEELKKLKNIDDDKLEAFLNSEAEVGVVTLESISKTMPSFYSLRGVRHSWDWGNNLQYTLVIDTSGTGRFWDFEGAEKGEERKSKEAYDCKPPKTILLSKEEAENLLPYLKN